LGIEIYQRKCTLLSTNFSNEMADSSLPDANQKAISAGLSKEIATRKGTKTGVYESNISSVNGTSTR
jgi:hypothetical protein